MSILCVHSPLRRKQCQEADFSAHPDIFCFEGENDDEYSVSSKQIRFWNHMVCVSPDDVFRILTQDLPGKPYLTLHISDDVLGLTINEEDDLYTDIRTIEFSKKRVCQGDMDVDKENRGKGIGRTILRNYIELGVHLRLSHFDISADALSNGSWTWGRAHVPERSNSNILIYERANFIIDLMGGFIPDPIIRYARSMIASKGKYLPSSLAYLDFDITDFISEQLNKGKTGELWHRYYQLKLKEYNEGPKAVGDTITFFKHLEERAKSYKKMGKSFNFGALFFVRTGYSGRINFNDQKTMTAINDYVGGFKTISLISRYRAPQVPTVLSI